MTADQFKAMVRTTLTNPRQGCRDVIEQDWPAGALWLALMLIAIVLSLLVSTLLLATVSSVPEEMRDVVESLPAYGSPIMFAVINWGQSVITVFVLHWIATTLGAYGTLRDMLAVMIWVKVMYLLVGVAVFIVSLVLPPLGGLMVLVALLWVVWAFVSAVDAATQFDNWFKSIGVCVFALTAFIFGMSALAFVITGLAIGGV